MSDVKKSAVISPCERYRYILRRQWEEGNQIKWMAFIMLNPSTADAEQDDQTIRKCIGFAKRERCGGLIVVNLFAYRATDPKELPLVPDKFGPDFFHYFPMGISEANIIVAAWGSNESVRISHIKAILGYRTVYCLGTNQNGSPKHPCYLSLKTPLEEFQL